MQRTRQSWPQGSPPQPRCEWPQGSQLQPSCEWPWVTSTAKLLVASDHSYCQAVSGPRGHIHSQAVSGRGSLPTSSWNPEWLRSASQQCHNPRSTPLGKHTTHLRLRQPPQDPAGSPIGSAPPRVPHPRPNSPGKRPIHLRLWGHALWPKYTEHSPYTLAALAVPVPLHSRTELASPEKRPLLLPGVRAGIRHWRET